MSHVSGNARSIFFEAVENVPPAQWPSFLDQACGDDAVLRQQVQRLLDAHADAGSFMAHPAAPGDLSASASIADQLGSQIGPYKLMEVIGEGGFGVVYVAEQSEPVRRTVALKVIKPGMDTKQVIARFEAEQQALALMDHPGIARVFDAGATESGRPYFVMELVKGIPITKYCDQCSLTTRERLGLFIQVCQAVQHAHQKGIIHRDVKPTNVLVTIKEGGPVPKVIDFGVAKALNQRLTERTLMTGMMQMLGTPLYMSPEQAEMSPLEVDTRADIYSLGVLLYELLTGNTPFQKDRLTGATFDELRRIIREEEPPRPSHRLSTLDAHALSTVADRRRTDPRRLAQLVRGDLDWIVMKCLEKDRARRYETANGLARDIERILNDEPVEARPPSASYKFRKFIRRNKGPVLAAMALMLTVLAGIAGTTVGLVRATAAKAEAHREAERARLAGRRERERAEQAQTEAAKAKAVSDLMKGMLFSGSTYGVNGRDYTVREWIQGFADRYEDQLHDQPEVDAEIRSIIGDHFVSLGMLDEGERYITKALELRRRVFGDVHPKVVDDLLKCAGVAGAKGGVVQAEALAREALGVARTLGDHERELSVLGAVQRYLTHQGKYPEADRVAYDALELMRRHDLEDNQTKVGFLRLLASSKHSQGKAAEAERLARQALALALAHESYGPQHTETAWAHATLGSVLLAKKDYPQAEAAYRDALAIFRKNLGEHHVVVATYLRVLARSLYAQKDAAGAEENLREAMAICRTRIVEQPELASARNVYHWSLRDLYNVLSAQERFGELLVALSEAIELEPDNPQTCLFVAMTHHRLGEVAAAREWYDRAAELIEQQQPDSAELRHYRAEAEELMGIQKQGSGIEGQGTNKAQSADEPANESANE